MRLDLFAVDGERKWTGVSDGKLMADRLSERTVLRLVRAVLRRQRGTDLTDRGNQTHREDRL